MPSRLSVRAVQIAVALEVAWALFLAYVVHHYEHFDWKLEIANYANTWAAAAIAIVVVTWLGDVAVGQFRGGARR